MSTQPSQTYSQVDLRTCKSMSLNLPKARGQLLPSHPCSGLPHPGVFSCKSRSSWTKQDFTVAHTSSARTAVHGKAAVKEQVSTSGRPAEDVNGVSTGRCLVLCLRPDCAWSAGCPGLPLGRHAQCCCCCRHMEVGRLEHPLPAVRLQRTSCRLCAWIWRQLVWLCLIALLPQADCTQASSARRECFDCHHLS